MQKSIISFICIFVAACSCLSEPVGKENEIIIIVSPEDQPHVERILGNLFSNTLYTPQPEKEFSIIYKTPWKLENVNKYGNIIITSLDFPKDSTGDYLMSRITKNHKKDASLFILENIYANNQILCGIHFLDAIAMEKEIENNGEWILNEFRNMVESRMKNKIFKHGINDSLSNIVLDYFGYSLDLQPDYKIIKADSVKPFLWIGRGYPYRWITIHKSKKENYLQKDLAWTYLVNEFAELMPSIKISEFYKNTANYPGEGINLHIMRGIYEHDESESGGPFFVYIFETETHYEVILVSGFVNYPGHEKNLLIKQLEIIAKTLKKGAT